MENNLPVHSSVGASIFDRYSKCPGSVNLSKGIPPVTSKYAEEGTFGHEVAADILEGRAHKPIPAEYEGMLEHLQVYIDAINKEWDTMADRADQKHIEKKFHLKAIHKDAFGTADAVIWKAKTKTLKVFDLKYGRGHVVEVKDNPQLKYYALGAMLADSSIRPNRIETIIVQPRAYHEDGPVRKAVYSPLELLEFSGDLLNAIEATEKPNAPFKEGEHCFFCPAKHKCPLLHKKAMAVAQSEFKPVGDFAVGELSAILDALPAIEAYVEGVRSYAYQQAENGVSIPGYKLVPKRAVRKWTDVNQVQKTIERYFTESVTRQCVTDPELKSVAQVEKVLGKKEFEKLAGLVVAVSSGNTLVPEDDNRAPVVKGASDFKPVSEQTVNLI